MLQAQDFSQECAALAELLHDRPDSVFAMVTQFKDWTINDVIGHLHMFNVAARLTLEDDAQFQRFFAPVAEALNRGQSMLVAQNAWLGALRDRALFDAWLAECEVMAALYGEIDPKRRIKWAGPDMSARSSITARQMETWAHGQEVFDCLGVVRQETDRIRNIAHLGVSTFGWTFINRQLPVPELAPFVELEAPSGTIWQWGEPQHDNRVAGSAVEFCQVVTQTRNIADTQLQTSGETARSWMAMAQCFAGEPHDPPVPGMRHVRG